MLNMLRAAADMVEETVDGLVREGGEGKKETVRVCTGGGFPKIYVERGRGELCKTPWRDDEAD